MAGAINIVLGLTVTDVLANLKKAQAATSEFTGQFKKEFDGLKGSADAPAGAFASLSRQLAIVKREIRDVVAAGGSVPETLAKKYALLQSSANNVRNAFNTPAQATPFQLLNQKLTETRARMQDILASGGRVPAALSAQYAQLNQRVSQVNGAFQQTPGLLGKLGLSSGSITAISTGLLAAGAALSVLKGGLDIASNYQRTNTALKAVSTSTVDYANSQNFLRGVSDQYGVSLDALSKSYVGFKANTNDTVLRGAAAEQIFLSVAKASAALQLSTEDTTGTLRAFGQMLSKGTVQSEELKGQVGERLYNAFGLAAKAMGVTTQELNKMLQSGQVMAVDLLPKLATQIDATFGANAVNNVNTISGSWQRAGDQFKLYIAEFSQTSGIDSFFARMGNGIADTLAGVRELQRQGQGGILDTIGGALNINKNVIAERAARIRGEFSTMPENLRLARLQMLSESVGKMTTQEQVTFIPLLKDLSKVYRDSRREARRLGESTVDAPVGFDIDKARQKQADYLRRIQNIKGGGGVVPAALQADYDKVTAQIERATEGTKKQRVAHESVGSQLTTNERILKRLSQEYKQLGDSADGARAKQLARVQAAVDADNARLNLAKNPRLNIGEVSPIRTGQDTTVNPIKSVVLGVELKPVVSKTAAPLLKSITDDVLSLKETIPGLLNASDIDKPLSALQRLTPGLESYRTLLDNLQKKAVDFSLKGLAIPPDVIASIQFYQDKIRQAELTTALLQNPIAYVQAKINQIREDIDKARFNKLTVSPEALKSLAEYSKQLKAIQDAQDLDTFKNDNSQGDNSGYVKRADDKLARFQSIGKAMNTTAVGLAQEMKNLDQMLTTAGVGFLSNFGESIGRSFNDKAEKPLKVALKSITSLIGDFLIQQGQALLLAGIFSNTAAALAGPFAFLVALPAAAQIAAGGALIAGGGVVKGIGNYAKGGLFKGESIIRVAENARAISGGGEWVTPVSMGADLISDRIMKNLNGRVGSQFSAPDQSRVRSVAQVNSNIDISGELILRGSDLVYAHRRTVASWEDY